MGGAGEGFFLNDRYKKLQLFNDDFHFVNGNTEIIKTCLKVVAKLFGLV